MARSLAAALALLVLLGAPQATAADSRAASAAGALADLSLRLSTGGGSAAWFVALANVQNRGTAVAEDVVVQFHLPEGAERLPDGPHWSSSPACGGGTTCVVPSVLPGRWASVSIIFRPGPETFAPVRAAVTSRTEDANASDNAATAVPVIAMPPPPGLPPPPPAPRRPPSAVVSSPAGSFVVAPTYSDWDPDRFTIRPSGTAPVATVAVTTAREPALPRLDRSLRLRPNALVRIDLAFIPSSYRFSQRRLRRARFERGRFGSVRLLWRVPAGARRGRAVLVATDLVRNELTYSFAFAVRPR